LRHADGLSACLVIGEDRKWSTEGQSDAIDPLADMAPHYACYLAGQQRPRRRKGMIYS
jgi:hypothetical protein